MRLRKLPISHVSCASSSCSSRSTHAASFVVPLTAAAAAAHTPGPSPSSSSSSSASRRALFGRSGVAATSLTAAANTAPSIPALTRTSAFTSTTVLSQQAQALEKEASADFSGAEHTTQTLSHDTNKSASSSSKAAVVRQAANPPTAKDKGKEEAVPAEDHRNQQTSPTLEAQQKPKKKSSTAKGKEPVRSPPKPTRDPLLRLGHTHQLSQKAAHKSLLYVLDQLKKYNTVADNLVHICAHDRKLSTITSRGLQHALLAFGQAETHLHDAMLRARETENQPSSSKVTLQGNSRDDYAFALTLLDKLKKRLRTLIDRFCATRCDVDVNKLSPSQTTNAHSPSDSEPNSSSSSSFGFRDIRLYNTMLNLALGQLNDVRLFQSVMFALQRRQITPNNITLTILLQHAGKRKDARLARAVVRLGLKMVDMDCSSSAWTAWKPASDTIKPSTRNSTAIELEEEGAETSIGRTSPSRVQSHPVMKLINSAIQTNDPHLLLALLALLDTFETEVFGHGLAAARGAASTTRPLHRPWPRISMSAMTLSLYPRLRGSAALTSNRHLGFGSAAAAGSERTGVHHQQPPRNGGTGRSLLAGLTASDLELPQHSPIVLTAVLTALAHEGRMSMISRVWALMKRLSLLGSRQTQIESDVEGEEEGEARRVRNKKEGAAKAGWLIPVRAATTYMKTVTAIIARDPIFRSNRSNLPTAAGGQPQPGYLLEQTRAAEARSDAARYHLVRCYLFLRRHWGINPPSPSSQRRKPQPQQEAHEKPDNYFFAVVLNAILPRYDGPLSFVDWRMVLMRLKKRFPHGVPPASVQSRARVGLVGVGESLMGTAFRQEVSSRSLARLVSLNGGREGGRGRLVRRSGGGVSSRSGSGKGELELEMTRLLLADMASLGIKARV
ncbi:hypothetical protein CF327_g4275 [Tilletia walkeri]|uniref:Uncharacterized protein n=1 Tax=Tilletia walkeri TaxID=117179 RepID=A0A8X7NDC3_9BASI|nr:hypothetical protein CF327_g4275 [Tilletia walkeri]KAE8269920.1 hypothetical protein A4X09_0g2420 [Tilletia walkeri]